MKKILVRAHTLPFDNPDAADMLLVEDRFGMNIGNILFANSVMRMLMTEDTQVDILHTGRDMTPENLERINAEYDCVVMPFANAFRVSFRWQLRTLTKFIRQLKIPCVIPGVGISATFRSPLKESNPFDREVKNFVKAVLEKSAILGTRGEETSAYLSRLGFKEGSEHRVIGCPSLFWYGEKLPQIEKKELRPDTPVSVNWKIDLPESIHRFMLENTAHFTNLQYVPQVLDEMRLMYYGIPLPPGGYPALPEGYPGAADHPWYRTDRARSFINVPSWLDYLKEKEFSFGSRIHGNIASVLAGIPCFVVVSDYRILELVKYHNIPYIDCRDLKEGDSIFRLYDQADYSRLQDGHRERFETYTGFLKENGLTHIFADGAGTACSYDRRMAQIRPRPALTPFFSAPADEQARRLGEVQQACVRLQQECGQLKYIEAIRRVADRGGILKQKLQRLVKG